MNPFPGWQKRRSAGLLSRASRYVEKFFVLCALFLALAMSSPAAADPLGERIIMGIEQGFGHTDASLLLVTRDLKWYGENMHRLPPEVRARVEQIRVNLASEAATNAARELGEAEAVFGATGSWDPGRDADIIYFGNKTEAARAHVNSAYERATENLLKAHADADPILSFIKNEVDIPKKLSTETMSIVVCDLPDFGYKDLEMAWRNAKEAVARGESSQSIMQQFHDQVREALAKNLEAHIASTAPDMYRGADGQEWFKKNYLEKPQKMRTFAVDPATGQRILKEGGIAAVPREVADRLGFGAFKGGKVKFATVASDLAFFYAHEKGGLIETSKYAVRMWNELDFDILKDISVDDMKPICVAELIDHTKGDPQKMAKILADAGMTEEGLRQSLSKMLYSWTEKQLLRDTERLVNELASHRLSPAVTGTGEQIDDIIAKMRLKFDMNELASGLDALSGLPEDMRKQLIATLKKQFAGTDAGDLALKYIMKQMKLLADEGGDISLRILIMLKEMGQATDDEVDAAVKALANKEEIPGEIGRKVKTARKEVMLLSCASALDFDADPQALDRLMEDWRKYRSGALIQSPTPRLREMVRQAKELPESELKLLGWNPTEVRMAEIRKKLPGGPDAMKQLEVRLGGKLAKSGITTGQFQSKLRELLFNPAYLQLGDESMSLGALDAFIGVATGLYQTYDILFNRSLSPEDENLELGNAWVTAIPVVGDFAQGFIAGSQAWYQGDKGKALESGMWIAIGVMGCVPGGQLPAFIAGIAMATTPIAAGVYDARQAQNLVQAWVESGDWSNTKPRRLSGLKDRKDTVHPITYEGLLTDKGNVPYKSERVTPLFGSDVNINDSIRAYAEQYIMPQYAAIANLRDALKTVLPGFKDKDWEYEFSANIRMDAIGAKGAKVLFKAYYVIRTQALQQTITQLKTWAEDEMRAAKDYEAEVARLKGELQKLEQELHVTTLVLHADDSVEAYSRVIKNFWEQESLPLSKLRIYEHYVNTYGKIAGQIRRVSDLYREINASYTPSSWHLTGFPEFDTARIDQLVLSMEQGKKGVIEHIEKLLTDSGQQVTKYDAGNECHKKAFDVLAPLRYKIAFIENLITYYKQLSQASSTWGDAYEAGKQRYIETRDAINKATRGTTRDIAEQQGFLQGFTAFVATIPYSLAAGDVELYRTTAGDYEVRLLGERRQYEMAGWSTGEAGKALFDCLLGALQLVIELSDKEPEEGKEIRARVRLAKGTPPKENYWYWKADGGLTLASKAGAEITVTVKSEGTLTAQLIDHFDVTRAKVLGQQTVSVAPGKKTDMKKEAEKKYQWLKESLAYLEALKEFDRKSYNAFEKSVTGSIVREFVSKAPPQNEKGFKLPDGPDKDLCGETFGDIKGRLTGYDSECWSALNGGCKTIGTRETTRTVDGKEMKILESVTSCDAPCGKAATCSTVLKTYTGQLGYANSLQDYVNERQIKCLADAGGAHGKHQRELDAKIKNLPESLPYKRFQEFAGFNDWKGYLAAVEKVKQEFSLPDPIPSPLVLPWTYSSPCGGGGAVADTSKLVVTLATKPEKTSYKPGDIVNVTASVTGGKAPYTYTWTGDHAGEGQTVTRAATKPGSYALTVEVKDGTGARGQASITLKYEGLTAEIAGLTNQIIYGTSLTLRVNVPGLGATEPNKKPAPKDKVDPEEERQCSAWKACLAKTKIDPNIHCLAPPEYECWDDAPSKPDEASSVRIIWQSDKTLDFQPGTSYDGKTDVLFDRMDAIKIWAEIEKKTGDKVYEKVGETDQREVTVVPPKFKMTFVPEKGKGKVGQEVRVTIETDPKIKPEIINYEWNWPESSGRMEYEKNASVIGFVPKDPKPVKLLVGPKTVYDRVPIGGAILDEYTAGAFNVTVTGPKQMGPTPQTWKEGVGLVNAEQQIAVFQNVSMRAEIAPDPENKPLRYQWSVTPGGCSVSNDISQEITVNCSQTGSYQAKVTVKDKDGVELGSGSGTISVSISQQTLNDSAKKAKEAADKTKEAADKTKKADEAKKKLSDAKADERKGKLDDAITKADEAATLDPTNKEAVTLAAKWKAEKKRVDEQLDKTKKLIDESKFTDAQRELIVAKNLHGLYLPVLDMEKLLTEKWRGYDSTVRDKLYEVRSANEKKDFKKALELADKMRKEMKLYGGNEDTLKQQEDWARRWEAEKDGKRKIFRGADEKLKNFDYAGAYKGFEEGFMDAQNLWNGAEPEYKEALKGREEAFVKNKRLNELTPHVQRAAEDMQWQMPVDVLQGALKTADEAIGLQPNNGQLKKWRAAIEARLSKTTIDNTRLAQGRKYLDAARAAENNFLSQDSYVRAESNRWGESIELSMQEHITKAIENYQESLKYIPDAQVEQHIKELQATLEGRKKFLENVRTSKKLLVDAEAQAKDARAEQNFDASQQKFAKAIETYQQSLNLYRPSNEEMIARIIHNLDIESKTKAFKKHHADGSALEQRRPVEALAALEKAATFRTYAIHEGEWILFTGQLQNLRSRVQAAKNLRARGEAQQQQGKITDAIASYEQSLKSVPDKALEEHVNLLRAQVTKETDKKVNADKWWQEGTALFNQGRPSDALPKFKESLTYWQDSGRTKYVQDLEGRRGQAQALRDQGTQLQQQNRLQDAIAKYTQSLQLWPDPKLKEHIASLEAKIKQDQETEGRKAQAKRLRDEGAGLQQQNRIRDAIGKYRESLTYWPDKQLEEHVQKLELSLIAVATPQPPTSTQSLPPVSPTASLDGTYGGPISGAATGTMQINVTGDRAAGTISGSYQGDRFNGSWSGTVNRTTGDLQGSLKGDVSGYAFTGSITGRIQGTQATGTWDARNQYGNPTGTWQATKSGSGSSASSSSGTGSVTGSASRGGISVMAEISNRSKTNAHVFTEGETFSPSNRLAPGEKRKVSVQMAANGTVTFKAGRDGQVIATKRWDGEPGNPNRVPVVIFDDTNPFDKLVIATGLR